MVQTSETMVLGVVVERRRLDNPWIDHDWRPHAVVADPPPGIEPGRELRRGDGATRYYAGLMPLTLHRKETESYLYNLGAPAQRVYVVLRRTGEGPLPVRPILLTAAPDEAQSCAESGEDVVDGVPMPETVLVWLRAFVRRHHVEQPHYKRQRTAYRPEAGPGGEPGRGGPR